MTHGLDPALVAAHLPSAQARFSSARRATQSHLDHHGGYVSWSGGKDSTVVVDLARRAQPDVPVVWFDSGLEFPDTHTYIHQLAGEWNLNLHIIKADPDALSVMEQSGAWNHDAAPDWSTPDLHETLVTVPARTARARFGSAEVWGLRASESVARRALLTPGDGVFTRTDGTVTFSPVWAWRDLDVTGYLAAHGDCREPGLRPVAGCRGYRQGSPGGVGRGREQPALRAHHLAPAVLPGAVPRDRSTVAAPARMGLT